MGNEAQQDAIERDDQASGDFPGDLLPDLPPVILGSVTGWARDLLAAVSTEVGSDSSLADIPARDLRTLLDETEFLLSIPAFLHRIVDPGCFRPETWRYLRALGAFAVRRGARPLSDEIERLTRWAQGTGDVGNGLPALCGQSMTIAPGSTADLPLSIVVTSRNDDHGGQLLHRMQAFLNGLLAQSRQHALRCELIIVEWNPPKDREPLRDALDWPENHPYCPVRIVQVPPELHGRYRYSGTLPLYQMIAKNVGIRRARGRFVLVTNIDILFSDALFRFLSAGQLERGVLYRVDRHDVTSEIPLSRDLSVLLEHCRDTTFRINGQFVSRAANGDILQRIHAEADSGSGSALAPLHTNACGDFQLMAREDWFALRGYAEFDAFSMHLDSLMEYSAHHSGIREVVLPDDLVTYHIDHSGGWSPEVSKSGSLDRSLRRRGIGSLSYLDLVKTALLMDKLGDGLVFNPTTWGFATEDLPETTLFGPASGGLFRAGVPDEDSAVPDIALPEAEEARRYAVQRAYKKLLLDEIVGRLRQDNGSGRRPLFLWGVGPKGRMMGRYLLQEGEKVAAFLDSDPDQRAEPVFDRPVLDPRVLHKTKEATKPFVLVGSTFHPEIRDELHRAGYQAGRDYYAPF